MAKTKKPSVWTVRMGKPVIIAPKAKKPRKTLAQKLDGIVLNAIAYYGKHSLLCGQQGWLPFAPENWVGYGYARNAIRRALREARRG